MSWAELLQTHVQRTLPWTGGRALRDGHRGFQLVGDLPDEHGWHRFMDCGGRRVRWVGAGEHDLEFGSGRRGVLGYLVGDRLLPDGASVPLDLEQVRGRSRRVYLVEPGLDRFARARVIDDGSGRLIYVGQEFPLGPEQEVLEAWQDGAHSVADVSGVTPALELAFLWLRWQQLQVERRRQAQELVRREEERRESERQELLELEAEVRELENQEQLAIEAWEQERRERQARSGRTTRSRRTRGADVQSAVRQALSRSEAQLLDVRRGYNQSELIIQYRFARRRFECVATWPGLRIIDAGVCLEVHGERGDTRFTVESLPGVIRQAMHEGLLHVTRPV